MGNEMRGQFVYKNLEERLKRIRAAIDAETESWRQRGIRVYESQDPVASNLQSQFEECWKKFMSNLKGLVITVNMEDYNPLVWTVVSVLKLSWGVDMLGLRWSTNDEMGWRPVSYNVGVSTYVSSRDTSCSDYYTIFSRKCHPRWHSMVSCVETRFCAVTYRGIIRSVREGYES